MDDRKLEVLRAIVTDATTPRQAVLETTLARLPEDAAGTIFVLGRVVGWIAHIAAEYAEQAMRLRPRGEYVGP